MGLIFGENRDRYIYWESDQAWRLGVLIAIPKLGIRISPFILAQSKTKAKNLLF